ncbi:hypothetical protein SAMN04515659_1258 [Dyella sp. 333MFSha]|nr:hypothetical protein SAMN04515659_1258 [Dyella sp. 333MFSha]
MQGKPQGKATRRAQLVTSAAPASVDPQAEDIDLPTEVPDALPNHKIPRAKMLAPLKISCKLWPESKPLDRYSVMFVDEELTFVDLPSAPPYPDPIELYVSKEFMDALPEGAVSLIPLRIKVNTVLGIDYLYKGTDVIFDKQPPGGDLPPAIDFDEDIDNNGLTLAKLLGELGGVLEGTIPSYEFQEEGDTINLFMKLRSDGIQIDAGTVVTTSKSSGTKVTYDRTVLEKVDGAGIVDFYYAATDDVGNQHGPAPGTPVNMLIKDAPETVPAPLVPRFDPEDDKLITDPDARPAMVIQIPRYTPTPKEGDYFIVSVGDQSVVTSPLKASDIGNDPLLELGFPYTLLFPSTGDGTPPAPIFTADVRYQVMRSGLSSPSEIKPVDFDLSLPGNPDPNPDPLPNPEPGLPDNPNENLQRPTLRGESGADNDLPADDAEKDATGIVPWLDLSATPVAAFKEGDVIQLYIDAKDGGAVGAARTVTGDDVTKAADLKITVERADLQSHSGAHQFYYGATRILESGEEVTAFSPSQAINIKTAGELPGGGTLYAATFVKAAGRRAYGINIDDARNGTPVRIRLDQTNVGEGDTIAWEFVGTPDVGTPGAPTSDSGSHIITKNDLVERDDSSLPKPPAKSITEKRAFVDIMLAPGVLLPVNFGHGYFDYTIENQAGEVDAVQDNVLMDVRTGN